MIQSMPVQTPHSQLMVRSTVIRNLMDLSVVCVAMMAMDLPSHPPVFTTVTLRLEHGHLRTSSHSQTAQVN